MDLHLARILTLERGKATYSIYDPASEFVLGPRGRPITWVWIYFNLPGRCVHLTSTHTFAIYAPTMIAIGASFGGSLDKPLLALAFEEYCIYEVSDSIESFQITLTPPPYLAL